ncbi:iron ABC transporter substrate-binding protein [Leucobacter sp. W1153]|uniref:iron ABC transporter substrate-binding protein n=1 Tax=Leucobacter sp. W1153 TaxID=3439064 RepID=UPI003F32A1C1
MQKTRSLSMLALAAITAALLVGCSSNSPEAPEASTGEELSDGEFTLYSGRNEELVQPLIDMFEEQSGIAVDVRYGDTAELGALLMEEGGRTPAQVFLSQDAGALGALADRGLFATLPAEITERVTPGFTSTDDTWVGVTGRARVIVFDSNELSPAEVPTTVDAFTEPIWADRLGIAPGNASFQSFVTAYRELNGEAEADEWVKSIAANEPQLFDSNGAILSAVNDGVVDAGLINHYYWFRLASELGASNMRAQLAFPESGDAGSIVNVTGAGMLSSTSTDADALEFIDFLLSPPAQEYFVAETFEYPLIEGVAAPEGLPGLDTLVNPELDLADLKSLAATQELLQKYGLI